MAYSRSAEGTDRSKYLFGVVTYFTNPSKDWSEVNFKLMDNLDLSNALTHDSKLFLSFIT